MGQRPDRGASLGERSDPPAGARRGRGSRTPSWSSAPSAATFTAEYKLQILRPAEACTRPGEIGALLRREGL